MNFINQLPSNPFAWLFTAALAIGAFILAYKSTPQKVLKFTLKTTKIIENSKSKLEKLKILYDEKLINNLTITIITFWNGSFPTINETDIIKADPLSICITNGKILDISVIAGDNTSNRIKINSTLILFDYLDKNEGGIIQVIHTGNSNSITLSKKIKGGRINQTKKSHLEFYIFVIFYFIIILLLEHFQIIMANETFISYTMLTFVTLLFFAFTDMITSKEFIPKNCKQNSKESFVDSIIHTLKRKPND